MKKQILSLLFFLATVLVSTAQDMITKRDGSEIPSKVTEVTTQEIKYKRWDNQSGPIYGIDKKEVLFIKYENGAKDIFDTQGNLTSTVSATNVNPDSPSTVSVQVSPISNVTNEDLYLKGTQDAERYYSRHSGPATWTLLTSLLINGLFGLIPAVACSSTTPKIHNLGYPDQRLMDNQRYAEGYTAQAKRKKSRKVWTNFAIGTAVSTVLLIAASQK